jgi:hypothetical protein
MYRDRIGLGLVAALFLAAGPVLAQGTAFSYQGRLSSGGGPASGPYEMRFTLHDAAGAGTTIGTPVVLTVTVTDGLFAVEQLDFGACPPCFDGSPRFLEVGVRPAGSVAAFTVLSPRQAITSVPYAMRATNAARLAGIDATGFVLNGTTPQAAAFNVSGNGTIGGNLSVGGSFSLAIVNAQTQYNLGGQRILAVGGPTNANLALGLGAGNPSADDGNTFLGAGTGAVTTGGNNTFVGTSAGKANVAGSLNAFFGSGAGRTTNQCCNAFLGAFAGASNTTGSLNVFVGENAGSANTAGFGNTFVGQETGFDAVPGTGTTTGSNNTFVGQKAGKANATGSGNTTVGANANVGSGALTFATALGADAVVTTSNTVVLGRAADTVRIPGALLVAGLPVGGGAFIQNGTALQPSSAFNVSDTGAANAFDARGEFRLQGQRFVSTSLEASNTFVGAPAGSLAGTGSFNAIVGSSAGWRITTAASNSFLGAFAGDHTDTGSGNVFVGMIAGQANTSGGNNTFVGAGAGVLNTTGTGNTLVGFNASGPAAATNATAIGALAMVTRNDSIVLGAVNGQNGATSDTNVGVGTTAPRARLEVANGDVYVSTAATGVVLKAPNGSCWRLTAGNGGALATTSVACP